MEYILHIGLHKTGTTSIQAFVQRNIKTLQANGLDFYQGLVFTENHVELHAASMRPDRESGYKNRSGLKVDAIYIEQVREHVAAFVAASNAKRIVCSSEGLSLLRYPDEMERLKSLFPQGAWKILVYLRQPAQYLRSYEAQLNKNPETLPKQVTQDSFAYTQPDSWLLDFQERVGAFKAAFGSANVVVIDYDQEMKEEGNVIPSFLRALGVHNGFERQAWGDWFLNKTEQSKVS